MLTALEDIVDQDGIRVLRFADLELGAGEICVPVVPGEQAPLLDRRLERHFLGGAVWRVRAARACEVRELCRCGRVFLRATSKSLASCCMYTPLGTKSLLFVRKVVLGQPI